MNNVTHEYTADAVIHDLNQVIDPVKAKFLPHFFKTGKGEYGEGDKFIGVTVPQQRLIANKYLNLRIPEIRKLLHQPVHECRLTALLI